MLKFLIILFSLAIGGLLYLQQAFQNGAALRYIDRYPASNGVPTATYIIGQGYMFLQSLPEATTYFLRVAQRYPNHSRADDAYFYYLQCLDDAHMVARTALAEGYQAYIDKYPAGK